MDHGNHDMPMGPKCSMHMLWNTQIIDTCVVFREWHINSKGTFVLSFFIIIALGVLFEYLRACQKALDRRVAVMLSLHSTEPLDTDSNKGHILSSAVASAAAAVTATTTSHGPVRLAEADDDVEPDNRHSLTGKQLLQAAAGVQIPFLDRVKRASLYGSIVFLSFFLMLVFMTYNAYLILAVVLGAMIGHFLFESTLNVNSILGVSNKGLACH